MVGPDLALIRRYLAHDTTQSEERELLEWLEASADNARYMAELMANISFHDSLNDPSLSERQDDMICRLNARIDAQNQAPAGKRHWGRRVLLSALAAAAAVAAVVFVNTRGRGCGDPQPDSELRLCLANSSTSVKTYLLADNTKVFLKPGSEISYDVSGLKDSRRLMLRGEAYFDVARDSLRPFIVHTGNISVKVLGTAFSVTSIPGRPDTEVVLERGKVRILSPDGANMLDLKPDQVARYNSAEGVVDVENCFAKAYVASHFNLVSLEDATLAQIVSALEDSFSTSIRVTQVRSPEDRYYFSYLKTDSLDDILSVLEFITGADCEAAR